ncbi:AMP-binding protein [Jiangella gansuensis]|uniref:AMP-binding protein n=1 Tax=Jiangella gansuensis TaxID=281473 RepID=UPI0004787AF6|nr:AMP-binding protein [Jiangella gansuensis]
MPIAREVQAHAAAQPRRVAVRCDGVSRTYAQLARDAEHRAADHARATPGRLVPLTSADPIDLVTGVLAADLAGAVPVVCDPGWDPDHRRTVLGALPPTVPGAAEHDLAWAGFTSGSTGRPRAVVRSRASWTGSYAPLTRLTGVTGDDTVLVPGPLASSLYAFAALHTLALGATLVLTPGWSPRFLRAELPGADVVHLVPHALETAVRAGRGRLRTAVVGGAALQPALRERADAVGVGIVAYYGAAELSFVAVDPDGSGMRPFPGVEVDVRPPGEVWVRSPWVAHGYLGSAGPLRRDDAGWATVGDLADAGTTRLRLRGRGDGAVLTGGATVVPEDVEAVLADVPGVAGVVVVGVPHDALGSVVAAVVEGTTVRRRSLEAAARAGLAPAQRPRRWYAVDQLPRTAAGKPDRALIGAGVAAGTLAARSVP